jgi:hypothetical protein
MFAMKSVEMLTTITTLETTLVKTATVIIMTVAQAAVKSTMVGTAMLEMKLLLIHATKSAETIMT